MNLFRSLSPLTMAAGCAIAANVFLLAEGIAFAITGCSAFGCAP